MTGLAALLVGMTLGLLAAAAGLLTGVSLWQTFFLYSGVGIGGTLSALSGRYICVSRKSSRASPLSPNAMFLPVRQSGNTFRARNGSASGNVARSSGDSSA